jgi:vancomycin resistance protein YoaR
MEPEVQKNVRKSGKRNIIVVSLLVFILLMLALTGQFVYTLLKYEKVYSGVTINGVDVGSLSKSELEQKLQTEFEDKVKDLNVVLKTDSKEINEGFEELGVSYDTAGAENEAFAVGRNGNLFERLYEIFQTSQNGKAINMKLTYNKESVQQLVDKFYNETFIEPKQADILIQDDKVTIRSGHHGESIDRDEVLQQLETALEEGRNVNLKAEITNYPVDKINADDLAAQINLEPQSASFKVENGKTSVVPHVMGRKIDKSALSDIVAELDKQENAEKTVGIEPIKPEITTEDAYSRLFKDTLATMRSHFSTGDQNDKNRAENMKIAVSKINGKILAPGDVFSFNGVVGPRTAEGGYQEAHTYVGGKVIDGIGGGICQISSTLYNAVLKSDMQVVERRNHMFTVGYVPKGQDATVSYGTTDFRFKNNTNWPIKVEAYITKDNYVSFALKGTNDTPGKVVSINSQIIKTTPFTTKYIDDPTLPEGKTKVKQTGKDGYVVDTFKTIKQDGKVISQTKLHRSTYSPLVQEVLRGTKKVADTTQIPAASVTPAPTPTPEPVVQGVDDAENPPAPEQPAE